MLSALVPLLLVAAAAHKRLPPSVTQLPDFKKTTNGPIGVLTTAAGAPVDVRDTKLLNSKLINSEYFMDEMQSVVRTRVPERVVHASGVGGFGVFEVTHDISRYCKAKMFSKIGKKTLVAVRLSLSNSRSGSPDTTQGSRGCALKWYTEDGNMDLTGFSVPMSPIKDPAKGITVISVLQVNPATSVPDPNMTWDFLVKNPEGIMKTMYEQSDYGAPVSYKDMPCHAIHTYQVYNEQGVSSFMRFHLIPCGGAKYLNGTEARNVAAGDPYYYTKGFYNTIANGDYPCYDLKAQILSEEDRKNANMDIFDITRVLDEIRYPLITIGRVTVNKNCQNHFQESDCIAFSPGNLVPGMCGAPDGAFEARRFAYRDAQIYRLGSNFKLIPVNCPIKSPVHNYIRDGVPPHNPHVGGGPNYYPNSFNGPVAIVDKKRPDMIKICEKPANNFDQARNFYSKVLTPAQRTTMITNIVNLLSQCAGTIQTQAVKYFKIINSELGKRVAKGLAAKGTGMHGHIARC